jgi:hypothetical protein
VDKDYFKDMNTYKLVYNQSPKSQAKSKIVKPNQKYLPVSQQIIDEYKDPHIPIDKLYMIDKVVRMRGLQGRFGLDHSEIMNYEFEQANKEREDHMNYLVYNGLSSGRNN